MKKAISLISFVASNQLHKRRICLVTIKKSGNYMAIVLSDMLSDSIKYKDLRSKTHTLIAIFLIRNSYLK